MRDDAERLRDMLGAIERISRYAERGKEAFNADELIQTWIVHHFELLGEAATGVSTETRARVPEVPWPKIVGIRNVLVHGYFGIDLDAVWAAVELLPDLRRRLQETLDELER